MAESSQIMNVMIILAGTLIVSIHFVIGFTMQTVFILLVVMYVIGYAVMVLVFMYKKKACMDSMEFDIAFYISCFIISIQVIIVVVAMYAMLARPRGW